MIECRLVRGRRLKRGLGLSWAPPLVFRLVYSRSVACSALASSTARHGRCKGVCSSCRDAKGKCRWQRFGRRILARESKRHTRAALASAECPSGVTRSTYGTCGNTTNSRPTTAGGIGELGALHLGRRTGGYKYDVKRHKTSLISRLMKAGYSTSLNKNKNKTMRICIVEL